MTSAKRPCCATCLRAQTACICQWIRPTAHTVEVLILQHPLEEHHAKGSARLLHLSLPGSRLVVGEVFAPPLLKALLAGPRQNILLYPDTPPGSALQRPPPVLDMAALQPPANVRLVVMDGTWRKSRKMIYTNPLLQALPRLPLHSLPASRYAVRKAHRPDQLSTLEATCAALAQLEGHAVQCAPLLAAFEGFVAQQMAAKRFGSCWLA